MSKLSDFLNYELYPALFNCLSTALPEFAFKRINKGYQSTSNLKITGEMGEKGKVYVYDNNISRLIDYTRNSISIFDYVQQRDRLSNAETLQKLAKLAAVNLPTLAKFAQTDNYEQIRQQSQIWEDAHQYFVYLLNDAPYAGEQRDQLKQYLAQRGYDEAALQVMQLGFVPSYEKLFVHLTQNKQYTAQMVRQYIQLHEQIGKTHILAIPYRDAVGRIKGIIARDISHDKNALLPKYLYSTGLKKDDALFNVKAGRQYQHLIVVEGLLDALHAESKGLDNVVALGGTGFNTQQMKQLLRCGTKALTLCLDQDQAGEKATLRVLQLLSENSTLKTYIAQLPEGSKDPDQYIKEQGVEAFKNIISQAIPAYQYSLQRVIQKYVSDPNAQNISQLDPQQADNFLHEISQLTASTPDPLDRDRLIAQFLQIVSPWGISLQSIENTVERLRQTQQENARNAAFAQLIYQAQQIKTRGNAEQALQWLQEQSRTVAHQNKSASFEHLRQPLLEANLQERLSNKPHNLRTGYSIAGEEINLPAGALSILCAPTSHGKTTFLINLLLNLVQNYPDKQIHLFSYEEDNDTLLLNALNTFINRELSKNNRKSIKSYFTEQSELYFEKNALETFNNGKKLFFDELIATQRLHIHYVDYDSDTLIDAIHYLKNNAPTAAILIDYMQLLHKKTNRRFNSRQEELKEICLDLKDMVVETGLPVVLGAQFNREVINPALLHPTKIGEAGDIERIAHLILGFWNNNFDAIGNDSQLSELRNNGYLKPHTLYLKLLKNRGGIANIADLLSYNGNTGKIDKIKKTLL
jgi:DNA primase catalytic core